MNFSDRTPVIPARRARGFTLVEVIVASVLLTMVATSIVALVVQNYRMAKVQSFRTQAISASLSALEQIRFLQYPEVNAIYQAGEDGQFTFQFADPASGTGYTSVAVPLNIKDDALLSSAWTEVMLSLDGRASGPKLPIRFYTVVKRNRPSTGTVLDVFEVILMYQWRTEGRSGTTWQTGNTRLIVPNLNPLL